MTILETADFLLSVAGSHVDPVGGDLRSAPIHWAVRQGHLPMVVKLLAHGADPTFKVSTKKLAILNFLSQSTVTKICTCATYESNTNSLLSIAYYLLISRMARAATASTWPPNLVTLPWWLT